jgi:hypothetical protein
MRPAVSVVVLPDVGTSVPSEAGVSDQVGDTWTALPNASVPVAVNRKVPCARTTPDGGLITTAATGPAVTVTVCVPVVAPAALAVSVWLPARVSR